MQRWGERSVFSVPLVFQDEVVGALTVVEKRGPRRFTDRDLAAAGAHGGAGRRGRAQRAHVPPGRRAEAAAGGAAQRQPRHDLDHRPRRPARDHRAARRARRWTRPSAPSTRFDPDTEMLTVVALEQRDPQRGLGALGGRGVLARGLRLRPGPPVRRGDRRGARLRPGHGREEPRRDDRQRREELSQRAAPLRGRPIGFLVFIETERGASLHRRRAGAGRRPWRAGGGGHPPRAAAAPERRAEPAAGAAARVDAGGQLERRPGRGAQHRRAHGRASCWAARSARSRSTTAAADTVRPVALWQRVPEELARASLGKDVLARGTSRRRRRSWRPAGCSSSGARTPSSRRRRGRCSRSSATRPISTCRSCSTGSRWACSC